MSTRVTMKDIARSAGVSPATVSRVLNGTSIVSPTKRAAILEWVRKLEYRPNFSAQALAAKRSLLIGILLPDLTNLFYATMTEVVEAEARRQGYSLILANSEASPSLERHQLRSLRARQVDGVLLVPCAPDSTAPAWLKSENIPAVCMTCRAGSLPSVSVSHKRGGILVAEHLMALGRRSFLALGDAEDQKLLSFQAELRRVAPGVRQLAFHPPAVNHITIREAQRRVETWFQENDIRSIDAVFAGNDLLAIGAMNAIVERGVRVPDDIALVGFDDTYLADGCRPSLTSVAQPVREMCRLAFDALLHQVETGTGPDGPATEVELEPRLVVRESTMGQKVLS
jgi:LacI family transcriptional regulator